jgi:transposase
MNSTTTTFDVWIGIDWEDEEHAYCVVTDANSKPLVGRFGSDAESIAAWTAAIRERFPDQRIAVCLEQARGALMYCLMQYDFLTLYPINPKQLADYRKAVYPSGCKSDPDDAELLARFLREHEDQMRAWKPDDATTRLLRLLTEQRREWVQDRVARTNELVQRLKESYPLALQIPRGDVWSDATLDFLEKFPSQRDLQRASPRQLQKWLPKLRTTSDGPDLATLHAERVAKIRQACPMTKDSAVLEHSQFVVTFLVNAIRMLNRAIADCETKIEQHFAKHPDAKLFSSFPGAGKTMAPRLAAAFGTDRQRFNNAKEVQQYSGIAPITKASGKTHVVHMRWACPKFLRQTFHEFAGHSIRFSDWAMAYYDMRKAKGHPYQEIVRGLAFKWQRILFDCWKNRTPYDEARYLQSLDRKNSPLLKFLPKSGANPPTPIDT